MTWAAIDVGFLVRENVRVDAVIQLGASSRPTPIPINGEEEILHDRPPLLLKARVSVAGDGDLRTRIATPTRTSSHARRARRASTARWAASKAAKPCGSRPSASSRPQSIAEKVHRPASGGKNGQRRLSGGGTGDFNAFEFTDGYVDAVGVITGDFDP